MNNNIEWLKTGIEERFNVELRWPNECECLIIQEALNEAAGLIKMYYPCVVMPLLFKVFIASKDIDGVKAMTQAIDRTIVLTPSVLAGPRSEMRSTITHELVHIISKTYMVFEPESEKDMYIDEGLTEMCTREILRNAYNRGEIKEVVCCSGYDENVDYVMEKIHEADMNRKTATTKYLNSNVNESFINEVFPI